MKQVFEVQGLRCGHCARAVTQAVQAQDPQAQVQVDVPTGQVQVESTLPREALAAAIRDEGYAVAA